MPLATRRFLLLAAALLPLASHAQTATAPRKHRLIIQVTDNDPAR